MQISAKWFIEDVGSNKSFKNFHMDGSFCARWKIIAMNSGNGSRRPFIVSNLCDTIQLFFFSFKFLLNWWWVQPRKKNCAIGNAYINHDVIFKSDSWKENKNNRNKLTDRNKPILGTPIKIISYKNQKHHAVWVS